MDATAQPRRAEPDAPYRRTDVDPIESTEGLSLSAFRPLVRSFSCGKNCYLETIFIN